MDKSIRHNFSVTLSFTLTLQNLSDDRVSVKLRVTGKLCLTIFPFACLAGSYCSGIHFRRVLSGIEGQLGQRMLCQMIGTRECSLW